MRKSLDEAYHLFFDAMLDGGMESILKSAGSIFESPVLFTDENYRLICQVPAEPIGNTIWDTLLKKKVLPSEVIWEYQDIFLNDQVDTYKPFYADWGPVADYPRIFGEVYIDSRILGHIAVFLGDKPLQDGDLEITQIFINALRIELSRSKNSNQSWQPTSSYYLLDLLDRETSYEAKNLAVQKLRARIKGDFAIAVTPIGSKASRKAFSSYITAELNLRHRNLVAIIYKSSIVTILGEVNKAKYDPGKSKFIKGIVSNFQDHRMVSGISDPFSNLEEAYIRYRQAELTAKIAISKGNTYLGIYRDYTPGQMYLALAELDKPETYVHPVLTDIKNYDDEFNTEYYLTLKTFCYSMHNKNSAASQLSIHRNSLLYRLNRIEDIFGISYEDEKTALHLLSSFLLLDADDMSFK